MLSRKHSFIPTRVVWSHMETVSIKTRSIELVQGNNLLVISSKKKKFSEIDISLKIYFEN